MVARRITTLEFRLAGTSCSSEKIPTIRMALARIISSTDKPLCFRPCLAKLRFAFATLILAPALHPRPWAASGGLPKLGLPHGNDGDRATPVLRLVRISKSQEIRPCWATGRIIHCSAVVERDGAGKILQAGRPDARLIGSQGLTACDLHVAGQHKHRLDHVPPSIAAQIE